MFYPAEMLRRGGRFQVYWLADSCPQRFAQLVGTNTVPFCEELMEVIATESSLPSRRFSLRLSSCLQHGLVLVHARTINVMLWDLIMMDSTILRKITVRPAHQSMATVREISTDEEAEMEAQAQAQVDVVAKFAKITLKEEEIPVRSVPNTPEERTWQLESSPLCREELYEPCEVIDISDEEDSTHGLVPEPAAASADRALCVPLRRRELYEPREVIFISDEEDSTHGLVAEPAATSADRALCVPLRRRELYEPREVIFISDEEDSTHGLVPEPAAASADRALCVPLRRRELYEPREVIFISDEDIPIPDEILPAAALASPTATLHSDEIILEELVEAPRRRARLRRQLAVDRSPCILHHGAMKERMAHPKIDTEVSLADPKWTSVEALWQRPARGWRDGRLVMSPHLLGLYTRNLAPVQWPQSVQAARDDELAALVCHNKPEASSSRIRPGAATPENAVEIQPEPLHHLTLPEELFAPQDLTLPQDQSVMPMETSHQPMETSHQPMETSHHPMETSHHPMETSHHPMETSHQPMETSHQPMVGAESVSPELMSAKKGRANVKRASAEDTVDVNRKRQKVSETGATLAADEPAPSPITEGEPGPSGRPSGGEDSVESLPQGSLDRTEVSLGDSDFTTASTTRMREHWGPSGTMKKILQQIERGERLVTVETLVRSEPAPLGSNKMAAARCFTSILQLKEAGFVTVVKNPVTQKIINIGLGPKSK